MTRILQPGEAEFGVDPHQAHHQRHAQRFVDQRGQDRIGDRVAAHDAAAEDVDQDRLDVGIRGQQLERVAHAQLALVCAPAADVLEH